MKKLIEKASTLHQLEREELIALLKEENCNQILFEAADAVRQKFVGDEIHLRGLIEFSNICKNNCCYCGLRRDNRKIGRYRLEKGEIMKLAAHGAAMGLKTIVLQSGEDAYYNCERLCEIISGIKKLNVALTLSIGEKSLEEYQAYRRAGADRFLLRIETTDRSVYERYDPNMSWEARRQCLADLRTAGLEVGSGCLVGLPGQTIASLADDIFFFKKIEADMIGIGAFIPHPDTPLGNASGGGIELALKVMALTRLLLPDINIPATTAMETLAPDGQIRALKSGANVIMPNITLTDYRRYYELYPGKSATGYTPDESLKKVIAKIESIGRKVGLGFGFHEKKTS